MSKNKEREISVLSRSTRDKVVHSPYEWTDFLTASANLYKYSFQDKLLIYAQNPKATACATMKQWNQKLDQWIKPGSKGIGLLRQQGEKTKIEYVFDIADTRPIKGRELPRLWKLSKEHEESVLEQLQLKYGISPNGDFLETLIDTTKQYAEQCFENYWNALSKPAKIALLSEQSKESYHTLFLSSTQYSVLSRCGIDADNYFSSADFKAISHFPSASSFYGFGYTLNQISADILRTIEKGIKDRKINMEKYVNSIAISDKIEYNKTIEFNTVKQESERRTDDDRTTKRETDNITGRRNGSDIPHGKWGNDSRPEAGGTERHRQVRKDAAGLHEGKTQGITARATSDRGTQSLPGENQRGSVRENHGVDRKHDEEEQHYRNPESRESNAMGAGIQQLSHDGRGNGERRTDLQLNTSIEKEAGEQKTPTSFLVSENDIDFSTTVSHKKLEIVENKDTPIELIPIVSEYQKLKAEYPYSIVAVQNGSHMVLYGEDVILCAQYIHPHIKRVDIPEMGNVMVAYFLYSEWMRYGHQLQNKGLSFVFANENENKYEIKKSIQLENIPLGTKVLFQKTIYTLHSIDYKDDTAILHDSLNPTIMYIATIRQVLEKLHQPKAVPLEDKKLEIMQTALDNLLSDKDKENIKQYLTTHHDLDSFADYLSKNYGNLSSNMGESEYQTNQKGCSITLKNSITFFAWNQAANELQYLSERQKLWTDISTQQEKEILDGEILDVSGNVISISNYLQETENSILQSADTPVDIPPLNENRQENFRITNDDLGIGGQKTKFGFNIAAIQTLKQIEKENRMATPEEQEILSKYVGWGGIPQAFDIHNYNWNKECHLLMDTLTDQEYRLARATVLNAHYTSPIIIKAVYQALQQTGFTEGRMLEPSCGIGNFFGLLPEEMKNASLYGVELDDITGRIAKQLYPDANITISGFEKTNFSDNYFDVAVGNIPFGDYKVSDIAYDKFNFHIHSYFISKSLDKVRTGGIVAFIATKGVLDKQKKVRSHLSQKADLVGAIRLPNNAFYKNAGTEITADILFFQKRESPPEQEPSWVHLGETENGVPINQYFVEHSEMVLGTMEYWANMYGDKNATACIPFENGDLQSLLNAAIKKLKLPQIPEIEVDNLLEDVQEAKIYTNEGYRNDSYVLKDNQLYFYDRQQLSPVDVKADIKNRILGLMELRDITRGLLEEQLKCCSNEVLQEYQDRLHKVYDSFTNKYGFISTSPNKKIFQNDSSYGLLCALETLNEDKTKLLKKADIFYRRTMRGNEVISSVDTASEALAVSLNEKGCVDIGFMASLLGGSEQAERVITELNGIIFKNPLSGDDLFQGWETADEYLSGNVREKLSIAKQYAEKNSNYKINVEKLIQMQPPDLAFSDISVKLSMTWIDMKYYQQFIHEVLGASSHKQIRVEYSEHANHWNITNKKYDNNNINITAKYGTEIMNAFEIMERSLNQQTIVIKKKTEAIDGKKVLIIDEKNTELVQEKQKLLQETFQRWLWQDMDRRDYLCKKYNEIYNNIRLREFDGSHLVFHGMNTEIKLRPHQLNAVASILYGNNTLLAHCVGAGKTNVMITGAMELKYLGIAYKSLIVVPNHIVGQWENDFYSLYPACNILVATEKDFEKQNRRKYLSKIATGNYDAIIMSHSQFGKIPISPEREEAIIQEEIDYITIALEEAYTESDYNYTIKMMERIKLQLQEKLNNLAMRDRQDDTVYFEELGIDRLFLDEAHEYKNLYIFSKMSNVAGINTNADVQKTKDLLAKCDYINEITQYRGGVFATGTPIVRPDRVLCKVI